MKTKHICPSQLCGSAVFLGLIFVPLILFSNFVCAQKDPSAAFQINSTTQGLLPPRMTTPQRDAIANPAEGLLIYNTTTDEINMYQNSSSSWAGGLYSRFTSDPFELPIIATSAALTAIGEQSIFEIKNNVDIYTYTLNSGNVTSYSAPHSTSVTSDTDVTVTFSNGAQMRATTPSARSFNGDQKSLRRLFDTTTNYYDFEATGDGSDIEPVVTMEFTSPQNITSLGNGPGPAGISHITNTWSYVIARFYDRNDNLIEAVTSNTISNYGGTILITNPNPAVPVSKIEYEFKAALSTYPRAQQFYIAFGDYTGTIVSDGIYRKVNEIPVSYPNDIKYVVDLQSIPVASTQAEVNALNNGTRFEIIGNQDIMDGLSLATDGLYYKKIDGSGILKSNLFN